MLFYFFVFLLGLVVGSFLNSVIYRLEAGFNVFKGRSFCPHCKHVLAWYDLFPLISFLTLGGQCRYCQNKISLHYPLVELTTGIIFVLLLNYELRIANYEFFALDNVFSLVFLFFVSCFLIIIFVYDLKHYIIPDKVVYPATALAFLYRFFEVWNFGNWNLFGIWSLVFGILPAFFFLAIILFSQGRWMGLGDFKLMFFMGLALGWPDILVALFLSFLIGAIIGTGLIVCSEKTLKSEVPFGPFLVIGTFITFFWGQKIISWYVYFLG